MLTTEWGTVRYPSCRDKGLVLVLVGVRPVCSTQSPLDRVATRTSTRPPHPHYPAPCPYRTLGRKRLNGYDYPIRSSTFSRGDHSGISKNRSRSRATLETRCINWRSAALPWLFQPSGVNCATYSYTSSQPRTSTRSKLSS